MPLHGICQFGKLKKALSGEPKQKKIEIDWGRQKLLPAISLSSLLSNDGLRLELDGTFKISELEISFLPKHDKSGNEINYNPYQRTEMALSADLFKKGEATSIHTFYFTVSPVSRPFSLMTCIHRPRDGMQKELIIQEGQYQLVFKVGGKEVHAFSFEVEKRINDDAYAAISELYFLKGDWNRLGRLSFNEYVEEKPVLFEFYVLNNTTDVENEHRPNTRAEIDFKYKVYKDGKVVAANLVNSDGDIVPSTAEGRRGYWNLAGSQFTKYPPNMDRNGARVAYFTQSDLTDGNYKIVLEREHFEGHHSTEEYIFVVKENQIIPLMQAERASYKDWKTQIEQGPQYSFIKKSN